MTAALSSSSSSSSSFFFLLLLLLLLSSFISPTRSYCYARDRNPYRNFASKSSYMEEKGYLRMKGELYPEGCSPLQMFHLIRHGTRYPSEGDMIAITTELPKLRDEILASARNGRMCPEDLNLLRNWNVTRLELSLAKQLEAEGYYEQEELGAQMLNLLPSLLDHDYSREAFTIRSTNTQRTRQSAHAYTREAIRGNTSIEIPNSLPWDPVLQFYERCAKFTKEVENNKVATEEVNLFVRGNYVAEVLRRVRDKTGYRALEFKDIVHMYDACRYSSSLEPKFCFSVVRCVYTGRPTEYWQDLKYYYTSGYGHKINYEQACLPVQDLVQTFRKRVEEDYGPFGVFYFTHLEAVLKVMARLGLFRDTLPLMHHNIRSNRSWRTSKIGPFSANLLFVLYKCPHGGTFVSAAVNERMVALPGCRMLGCSWAQFLNTVGRFQNCDFDEICENEPPVLPLVENSASGGGSTSFRSLSVMILGILQTFLGFFTFGH